MLQSICFSSFAIKSAISAMHSTDWLPSINVDASDPYHMGWQIGQRFKGLIKSRMSKDPFLYSQLLPYAATHDGQQLVDALSASNKNLYPRYWSELQGIADGSYTSLLEVLLLNFRKEIMPFITCRTKNEVYDAEECSDVAICSSLAALGHNEDANVSVQDHIFLVHASLSSEASFTAFTLAGELPSCAFGFNSYGVGFTLNAVPPLPDEVVAGGIGRNFVSRDLLESTCLEVALQCVQLKNLAVGHSYNIFDICSRKIVNVETASRGRFSVKEIGATPFFHANMYRHLDISQVQDESSLHRHARAADLPKFTKDEILSLLGDTEDELYPIYMQGPVLHTLCTIWVDVDARKLTIYSGRPSSIERERSALVFDLTAQ
ncbi:hypothetical protein KP509_13G062900 [Ceratopteris richardii]|uniref:Peptidase C45 hydrolase domain-containing protein n=2 Tax=Ceratopteris richardii TaxID=49495 RepID=A0A8T2TGB2_CERRI|nr:hypothetical protein KP509_13G062900 [Ceratopteris richardii]